MSPQSGDLERIARACGLSLAELAVMGQKSVLAAEPIDILKVVERSTRVALISWTQAGSFGGSPDVVVRLDDCEEVAFRRLVVDGRLEYLRPANSNWPQKIIEMSAYPGARIIGVVIGKWVEK